MSETRKIIHIDMDAFYAAIEQRDNPSHRGKPVIVGGDPEKRGVVATASYEARKFGIHSAMAASTAKRLCPNAIFLRPRMEVYRRVSREIMSILQVFTDLVEPVSIDEAFLDVTQNKSGIPFASQVARQIKDGIEEATSLTASAGVGPNKFIAKIASDMNKPDGLTVIPPEGVEVLLRGLPIRKVPGIGRVTEEKMKSMGINTVGDLRKVPKDELVTVFGKVGAWYYLLARGDDDREVQVERVRKSIGSESTFEKDLCDTADMITALRRIAGQVEKRMVKAQVRGRTVTLKVTYADFKKITRSKSFDHVIGNAELLYEAAAQLLEFAGFGDGRVRLLGITVSNLDNTPELKLKEVSAGQMTFPFFS